jgi:hypothetical protein
VQPIQDLITLRDIAVAMAPMGEVAGVRLVPEGDALSHATTDGTLHFTVPRVRGHQMIEVSYA